MSSAHSDRNLLFGVLALQADFLDAGQFAEVCSAWAARKDTPLADLLVQRGWLSAEDRDRVDYLLKRKLDKHQGDARASLAEVTTDAVRRSLAGVDDADVRQSIAELPTPGLVEPGSTTAHQPEGRGRYKLTRLHAQGGIGQVWLARDAELGRDVALKELRPERHDHPAVQARFLEEACITGQLEHPGIVPVHELIRGSDGRPFYTMRMVRGRTLAEAIKDYHRKRQAGEAGPLELRGLLGAFVAVCNAVAYAHSRGVVHRDLKPANVVLGGYGEVVVLDWGLARLLGRAGSHECPVETGASTSLLPVSLEGGKHDETLQGQVLGTPAYMAPEQAEGRLDLLGPATDVYGLGAVLYELLCGQAPFCGPNDEVLRQVTCEEPEPPCQRAAATPAALEAVCRKAMEKKAAARYGSAGELSREIERWLADEPVSAYREPWTARCGRWMRRHRVLAASVAAAVLVTLVLGTAGSVYRQQQRLRAREQAKVGLTQVAQLRDGYRYADAAKMLEQVRGWVQQAGDGELEAGLSQVQADLELARDLDDLRQRAEMPGGQEWVAWLRRSVSDPGYEQVLARHGLDVLKGDPAQLAEAIQASAVRESIVAALDDWARGEKDHQKKQRLLRLANSADEPDVWRHAVREAIARQDWRRLRQLARGSGEGKPTPGVVLLLATIFGKQSDEAMVLLRRMHLEQPGDFWISFNLGIWLNAQQRHQEAAECYLAAAALRPDSAPLRELLGTALGAGGKLDEAIQCYQTAIAMEPRFVWAHANLGKALHDKGRVDEAIQCYRRAIAIDPTFAPGHSGLGYSLRKKGKVDEAIACFQMAIHLDPKHVPCQFGLGTALRDKGKVDEAMVCYRKTIQLDPRHAKAHHNLGNALKDKGKVDEAMACWRRAIRFDPKLPQPYFNLGRALQNQGKLDEAIMCFYKAIELNPTDAWAHNNLGNALNDRGKVDEAIQCLHRAIHLAPTLASPYNNLGLTLRKKGKVDEAIAYHYKAIELDPKNAKAHTALGLVLESKGKIEEAIGCFRKAIEVDPASAGGHGALGFALMQQGAFVEAQKSIRRSLALLPPGARLRGSMLELIRQCRQLLAADGKLRTFLAGKGAPADAVMQVQMADVARRPHHRLYLTSVRLYRDAFAREPSLADAHRYNAACAAALAGCGQGKDVDRLDEQQRAGLRRQALNWLRVHLTPWGTTLAKGNLQTKGAIEQQLRHWQSDGDLAGVRDRDCLAKLPEDERKQWEQLWADVETLRKKAGLVRKAQ
jgi:tetratricopeptide (TPR) repeat protein/tRNA A-37 threonylcarbamoyl transferase component Bud32